MAIGIFNSLIFGNIDSADYGIYITGEAVYNAPERAVDMVKVPGRNGALALDLGRWENIEVSYPAGCFGGNQNDFATKISNFRNAIVSQIGYQRLTDTYNPNEYRMGVYASGLDVKPAGMGRVGEFTITFDCKPQRFLTSGETEETVSSGGTLTNPTPYASSPLLMIKGYGELTVNGYAIDLSDELVGRITLLSPYTFAGEQKTVKYNGNQALVNAGDSISCVGINLNAAIEPLSGYTNLTIVSVTNSSSSGFTSYNLTWGVGTAVWGVAFQKGSESHATNRVTVTGTVTGTGGAQNFTVYIDLAIDYYSDRIEISRSYTVQGDCVSVDFNVASTISEIYANSTRSVLGDPTYIDCDLGECYQYINDAPVSINRYIALGSDLPVLSSGENEITFDNTITELKVIPRWWKL